MKITSAKFIKGIVGPDETLQDGTPQVAFIGRSNVGKSSVINSLTGQKALARTSSSPGRTREINLFFINDQIYLLDLPGYGFTRDSRELKEQLQELINWYLFVSPYEQKTVVMIIDGNVGSTNGDLEMLKVLDERNKNVLIVANKIDKVKSSKYNDRLKEIQDAVGDHKVIPYSSKKRVGIKELTREIFS